MTFNDAISLMNYLKMKCPYDTGNLKASIQAPQGNEKEWIIVIGNEDSSINGTPSNRYASILNDAKAISVPTKNGYKTYTNRHYHWVNAAIREWIFNHYDSDAVKLNSEVESEDE